MEDFAGNPVNNAILEQYDKQKTRGQQGFGIFDGQELNMVHEANENQILKWLVKYDSNLLLMHHRWPTSTINVKRAAHPFSTKKYFGKTQYILVHNGTISNAEDLYDKHFDRDIDYYSLLEDLTFNDSEALLWDFALYMEGKQKEIKAVGQIAFICLKLVKGRLEKMYFARNSSPLKMTRTKEGISLASELEGGEDIERNVLYTWNYKLKRLTQRKLEIPSYIYSGSYGNASAYTPGSYASSHTSRPYPYPTWEDCNCKDVDWENCIYHAQYDDSDWRNDLKQDNGKWNWRKNEEEMGERIGNTLKRKFGEKFGLAKNQIVPRSRDIIEYEPDKKTQILLPLNTAPLVTPVRSLSDALNHQEQRRASEDSFLAKTEPIGEEEVTQEYMAYLAGVKGHFEQAYWAIEVAYEEAQNAPNTKDNIRRRRIIEKVMERIDTDPEYVGEEAVSNVWRTLWQQSTKT